LSGAAHVRWNWLPGSLSADGAVAGIGIGWREWDSVATGTVIRFDEVRGYGFVDPDAGGEDIFVHVNDLEFDKQLIAPGVRVEFAVEGSERGLKASGVRVVGGPATAAPTRSVRSSATADDGERLCDVFSAKEFTAEVTELLLGAAPTMTAGQVVQVRQRLIKFADCHGWIDV
jgi:cold shock CspA family protein